MEYEIMGFLATHGWQGAMNVFFLIIIGTIIGTFLVYFLLIFKRDIKPKRITVTSQLIKLCFFIALLYVTWII